MTNGLRKRGPRPRSVAKRSPEEAPPDAYPAERPDTPSEAESEKVGYKNPPKNTRWKRGRSGNPNGRPKGRKNLSTILSEVVFKKVRITEGGRTREIPAIQAVLLGQLQSALAGDHRAADKMIRLIPQVSAILAEEATADAASAAPRQNDTEVLEEFVRMIREAEAMGEGGCND